MSSIYAHNQNLARVFARGVRRVSIKRIFIKTPTMTLFRGRGGTATTDIFISDFPSDAACRETAKEAGYFSVLDDVPVSQHEGAMTSTFGFEKSQRGGTTPFMPCMQTMTIMKDEHDINSTEYSREVNFSHCREENMDRIVAEEPEKTNDTAAVGNTFDTKSFIPVDIGKSYLNEAIAYYRSLFGRLPNEYYAIDYCDFDKKLNLKKSMGAIEKSMDVRQRFVYRGAKSNEKKTEILEVNYVIGDGILLFLSDPFNAAIAIYDKPEQLDCVLPHISAVKNKKIPEKPKFKLLVHNQYGFGTEEFDLKAFDVNVADNYNDDLPDDKIRNFINADGEAGLCILHGKPGTGKTYYIRDLIKNCKRDFIYMNKECLGYINDSSFIAFLVNHKNSVFIMEDCENVLVDRSQYNNTISTLLNLSDGLLGDSLNNKFVCTFNTDISNIDEALLRKGRMKVCYEFKYLSPEKANKLAEKLDKKDRFDKDVPLCDVMNSESNGGEAIIPLKRHSKIGF